MDKIEVTQKNPEQALLRCAKDDPESFHITFMQKKAVCSFEHTAFGGRGWIRTIEAIKQQIYSLPPLATRELSHIWNFAFGKAPFVWSWQTDLNPRPADYKTCNKELLRVFESYTSPLNGLYADLVVRSHFLWILEWIPIWIP